MGNKKIILCIVMFFIILIFGILAPDLSNRDKYIEDKYASTEDNLSSDNVLSTEDIASSEDILSSEAVDTTEDIVVSEDVTTEMELTDEPTTEEIQELEEDRYLLSYDVESKIDHIIDGMTLEEKVGQLFFIKNDGRFNGSILKDYPVGGVILFKGDFMGKTQDVVKNNIIDLQDNSSIPLLIGIDEEGGTVVRLSSYSQLVPAKFRSPREIYNNGGFDAIREDTIYKSQVLLSYGINVNFAPVCDVPDGQGDFIYKRAFNEDVELTREYTELMVVTMGEEKVGSVLKHFPGYGNNEDTHNGVVRDSRTREEFDTVDLIPFEAGIESGAWCILVSHNIVECMDKNNPATLSPEVHRMLREDMSFGGVIITDDLMMGGVSKLYSKGDAAVLAVLAGNDMILSTDYQVQYEAVLKAVEAGKISQERIEDSVRRILRWKYTLGLLDE